MNVNVEQSYALRRRFGMIAEDEVATDLISAINSEICSTMVRLMASNAPPGNNVNWPKLSPSGVSDFEHRQSFKYALSDAESKMIGSAGRGTLNVLIAGRNASSIISSLPGFVKLSDGTTIGPHIYGTLDGVTVIRIPNSQVLSADKVLGIYKGTSPFEGAGVLSNSTFH